MPPLRLRGPRGCLLYMNLLAEDIAHLWDEVEAAKSRGGVPPDVLTLLREVVAAQKRMCALIAELLKLLEEVILKKGHA